MNDTTKPSVPSAKDAFRSVAPAVRADPAAFSGPITLHRLQAMPRVRSGLDYAVKFALACAGASVFWFVYQTTFPEQVRSYVFGSATTAGAAVASDKPGVAPATSGPTSGAIPERTEPALQAALPRPIAETLPAASPQAATEQQQQQQSSVAARPQAAARPRARTADSTAIAPQPQLAVRNRPSAAPPLPAPAPRRVVEYSKPVSGFRARIPEISAPNDEPVQATQPLE